MASLAQIYKMFPDDEAAERWFAEQRWRTGEIACAVCGSLNVLVGAKHKTMPYRCRDCGKRFSVRTNTVMESSRLGFRTWAIAIYLLTTSKKGMSSYQLANLLGVQQKTAWYLAHRIREASLDQQLPLFRGPVEADETYIGGLEQNKHRDKRLGEEWQTGKSTVFGLRDRRTGRVAAKVIPRASRRHVMPFIEERTTKRARLYTDQAPLYKGAPRRRSYVSHNRGQYVDGDVHTNGIESFWALVKRQVLATHHWLSKKHLHRYIAEMEWRYNTRRQDDLRRMGRLWRAMHGRRLPYAELVG